MATIATRVGTPPSAAERSPRRARRLWKRNSGLIVGAVLVALVILVALVGPLLDPYNPIENNYEAAVQPPSAAHPFGTDKFGRDQLSRIITGTRIDLSVGIICTLIPAIIGIAVGSIAGYYGGKIDTLLMRIVDIQVAFPFYVLLIAILAILGPGT